MRIRLLFVIVLSTGCASHPEKSLEPPPVVVIPAAPPAVMYYYSKSHMTLHLFTFLL